MNARKRLTAAVIVSGIGLSSAIYLPSITLAAPPAQVTPEEAALVRLNAARRAFNEKNYPVAIAGFKEFLANNGGSQAAPGAWFGLGLSILNTAPIDLPAASDALGRAAGAQNFSDQALAKYYYGFTLRAIGRRAVADAFVRPNEAEALNRTALQQFTLAQQQFAAAQAAFEKKNTDAPVTEPAPLPVDVEWAARARCDNAEMLVRLGKFKEALDLCSPFQADAVLHRSKYRQLGLYQLGYAQFMLRDYPAAGRSLSQLAPFAQDFGLHARYLLARVHQLSDERPEAAALYKSIIDDYDARKKAAEKSINDPAIDVEHRAQLDELLHGPVPDYVARSQFYSAVLKYEDNKFSEAADAFAAIQKAAPTGPLAIEARLRQGYCLLSLKKFNEARVALEGLRDDKTFGDRAMWWNARALVGGADPANAGGYQEAVRQSVELLRRAITRAQELAPTDPSAKTRRLDMLLDLGDIQQLGKQYRESAVTYQQIIGEDPKSDRAQEAAQRRVTALHLGGFYAESDAAAEQFAQAYPKSTLLPAVLFRQAENAYMSALDAADGKTPKPREEQDRLFNVAIARYQKVIEKYPEFDYIDLARQATAVCDARLGKYAEAIKLLQAIPDTNRDGELALVPYLLADCEIRTLAPQADDALSAERLIETAEDAAKSLESFINAKPAAPQLQDAMLKLGYCYQRIAEQIAAPDEKAKTLAKAKEVYDKLAQAMPNDASQATVVFERAKVLADLNDVGNAQNEFARFINNPLHQTPNAPLAMVRLSSMWRATGQTQQAIDLMKRCRDEFEKPLAADPQRAGWVPLLQYEHALALQEGHKLPEALAIYEDIVKQFAGKPAAINAQWRIAQCRRQDAADRLAEARAVAERPGVNPNEVAQAYEKADEALKPLAAATDLLKTQADAQAVAAANAEPTLRMVYQLAWCYRTLGDREADAARLKLQHEAADKMRASWPKDLAAPPANLATPYIAPSDVPIQPAEQKARDAYQRVIFAGPTTALGCQARFELAELLAARGQVDDALNLLSTALENQPPKELTQRIKVRVAAALLAKNNVDPAIAQLKPLLAEKDCVVAAEARYLAGEASIQQQDWTKAIEWLIVFRDQEPFRNAPGLVERALLRLGHAFTQAKQYDQARASFDQLINRFPQSQYINDARFGTAWAMQSAQRYDEAINLYTDLRNRTVAEPAARAMMNIGVCKVEQKKSDEALKILLAVPDTYNYPDCTAGALYNAGRAQVDLKQPKEAVKLWNRVLKEYPGTTWATLSQQRLAEVK